MLKIIDVDSDSKYKLSVTFSDGRAGVVDLTEEFSKLPLNKVKDFNKFSLSADGFLNWQGNILTSEQILLKTKLTDKSSNLSPDLNDIESVLKRASWESMQEGRPDILQAAIRSYVEFFGHNNVIKQAGIKSRTSAYRSLKPNTTPNFGTLVQLGHAIIKIAEERAN